MAPFPHEYTPRAFARVELDPVTQTARYTDREYIWHLAECNPNGQWAFTDAETVERITGALADLLQRGEEPV